MKHHQTLRRGLSILLSLVLCLSLLPATALAEGTATTDQTADFTDSENISTALERLTNGDTSKAEWSGTTLTLKGVNFSTSAATAVKLPEGAKIVLTEDTTNTIASAAENAKMSYGIYATGGLTIEGSGTLTVRSAKATTSRLDSVSYGIYADAGDITITSGTVVTTGGEAALNSCGIRANGRDITISGGTVIAASGTANGISYGISTDGGNITISGGAVAATGGISYGYSGGISGRNVEISGGTVTATGGQASSGSRGIVGNVGLVQISGGVVTATGSTAGYSSYGIYGNLVKIFGGVVTATGGELTSGGTYSCGIKTSTNTPITISGGHVIARTQASTGTRMALGAGPDLKYSSYYWRISSNGSFTNSEYEYSDTHTYVEFSSQNNVTIYTVTVQTYGNGSADASPTTAAAGTEITLTATPNSGYRFKEWQVISGTVAITDNKFTMPESDVTVKAIFEADAPSTTTYTVTFDPNGGSGSMDAVTGVSGSYTLPTCTFTAPGGKQFKAWSVNGNEYAVGASITVNADTIVTALWEDIFTVTVTTDSHGSGTASPITAAAGTEITLSASPNIGYHFKEWQVTNGDVTITGNKFTMPASDVTVEAIFEVDEYTVTLNVGGGTINSGNVTKYTYGAGATLPTDVTKEGYTFEGWYADEACTGDPVTEISATATAEKKYWAKWTPKTYDITYEGMEGAEYGKDHPTTHTYDTATVISDPTRIGYTFDGWLVNDAEKPVDALTLGATDYTDDITLTAVWTPNVYDVTLITNGGTILEGNVTEYTYSVGAKLPVIVTRSGYRFIGWYDNKACKGEPVTEITATDIGDKTFYAAWTVIPVTPTYPPMIEDADNGSVTVSPESPAHGVTVTISPKADDGYEVGSVTVTDKNGNPVKVTNNGDGTYSFTQPEGQVTVKVTFVKTEQPAVNPFVDVPTNAYYYDAVLWAAENGITGGVDDTHFAPNAPCTRAQMVTFLWRAAGCPAPESRVNPFTDVAEGSYYYEAVLWAVEQGITKGTSDTTFSPNATCTRAQIVTFLWRAQKSPAAGTADPFTDVAADAYYADAVLWAVENGVTNGTSDTTFSPNANCTRAQIVTFLFRCLGEE